MSDISKIKLASGKEYNIKDSYARELIGAHTHPIDTELDDSSTNPVQNSVITNALNNKADIDHTHNLESLGIAYAECNNTEQIIQIKTLKDNNIEHTFSNNDVIIISNDGTIGLGRLLNIDNTGNKPIYYNNEVVTISDELTEYDYYNIDKSDTKLIFIYDEVNDRYNFITTNRYATNNKLLNNHYGFCTTSELLDNKCIIIDNYYNINTNDVIIIKFAYNVNNNATLNINNTGNKPIYYKNTAIINGMINSGDIAIFMYDEINDRYNLITTDDYLNENLNNYYTESCKCKDTYFKYWPTLIPDNYILENGDVIIIVFNNNIISNAKLNINNTGAKPLYYRGFPITDGIIKTGDTCYIYYNEINNVYELLRIPSGSNRNTIRNGTSAIDVYSSSITSLSITPYDNNQNLLDGNIFFTNIKISGDGKISNCTFNINNTGDKPIYYKGFPITDNVNINRYQIFRYDIVNDRYDFLTSTHHEPMINNNPIFVYENQHLAVDYNNIIKNNVNINDYKSKNNSILSIKFNNDIITGSYLNINDSKNKIISNSNNNFIHSIMIKAGDIVTFLYNNDVYNIISNNRNSTEYIYTYCQTSESESNKIISINNYNLKIGDIIRVYFYESVNANSTININNTGAKPIKFANKINAGDISAFLYDGDKYNLISIIDSKQKNIYCICNTAQSQNNKSISINKTLYNLSDGSIVSIKFTNAVNANSTININNIGDYPIYYKGSAITDDVIKAGNIVTFIYQNKYFYLVSIDSFNNAQQGFGYGICNSMVSDIYNYSVNINNYNNLTDHDILIIKFKNNVITNATLNINDTGDKPIYYNDSPIIDDVINAEEFAIFKYDETNDRYNLLITNNYTREKFNNVYYFSDIYYLNSNIIASSSDNHTPIDKDIIILEIAYIYWSTSSPNPIININNSGNKPIYRNGEPFDDIIISGNTYAFEYDETNDRYNYLASLTSNNENYGESSSGGLIVPIDNYNIESGGIVSVKFNNNIDDTNATLNINYKGAKPIYYNGSTITDGIIKAGDIATFIYDGTRYHLISLDRDFNPITVDTALSTTSNNPVQNCIITDALNNHTHDPVNMGFGYGICDTERATIAKTVSIDNYKLINGGIVSINFYYDVLAGATLNINNTGAKEIYYNGSTIIDGIIKAGDIATFIYDGYAYNLIATDNITNEGMGFGYGECDTEEETLYKTVSITNYKLTKGGIVSIFFYYNVPVNATLNINNTGDKPIYCNGAMIIDNTIESGDIATFIYDGRNYNLISLDRDFNPITIDTALSTTSTNPVENNVITNALNNHTHTNESMGFGYSDTNYSYFCGIVDNYTLTDGNIIICEFEYNVSANATLSINSTGDKPIYYNGSPITDGIIEAGDVAILKYNENLDLSFSRFDFIGLYDFYELDANNSNSQEININVPYALANGQIFNIKFDYDVPANAVLNISSMSDIPIYYKGSAITDDIINAGDIATFIYNNNDDEDETNDRCDLLATDNYNNENVNHYYYATALICYRITLDGYTQTKNGIVSIKFDYDVVPNATLNINSTGVKPMYHNNITINGDIIKAGDIATFIYDGRNYNLISLDRDFNNPITIDSSLSTTSTNPVQNNVITNALNNKADANHTHTDATASSGGLMSATDKANIDNFAANFKNKLSIANGIATLDSNGRVPSTQLPSYVDDIIEGYLYNNTLYEEDTYTTEIIGETGKIYVDLSTNKTYRWGGSNYIEISESLALGETSSTAYRGDYGKIAYEHAQSTNNPHNVVPSVYGYCYTERMLETKIVTINDFKLIPGMIIFIRFTYGVRYQAYLNISNTGAKPIYYKGKINDLCVTENGNNEIIQAGDIVTFIYDAANNRYNLISTNIIGNQRMGSGDAYCDTAASVNEKSVSIKEYVPFEGGIVSIYFVNAVNANSKLKINNYSSISIWYRNSYIGNGIIKAGDRATFMYTPGGYYLISLDRDFNDPITIDSSLSTTSTNPVQNSVITNALNNYIPTIVGTQIESTNNWTGNAQFETLEDGQRILYYLPYDNSSGSDVVLNLTLADGTTQTGNIDCYLSGSTRLNSQYEAGSFIPLIYKENITFNGSSTTYTGWWAYTDKDIDSKVQNTLNNTTKAYVTGTTNNTTNIGTQIFDDNVYLGITAGELNTKSLKLNEKVTLNYNTNNNCIDFIFS